MRNTSTTTISPYLRYYPFGMGIPGRSWSVTNDEEYRFGFNGMEGDDAIKGDDNSLYFGDRNYDPRLGRFISLDGRAKQFPENSPYVYAINNPIFFIDENGEGPIIPKSWWEGKSFGWSFACGIVDGLWETGEMAWRYNPINPLGTYNIFADIYNFVDIGIQLANNSDLLDQVYEVVEDQLGEYVDDISGSNGSDDQGYAYGKLVLDVALMFVGAGEEKKAAEVAESTSSFVKLMKSAAKFERGILNAAKSSGKYLDGKIVEQVSLKLADGTMARFDGVGALEDGTFQIIEAKMGGGKLSTNQQKVLEAIQNGDAVYATSGKAEQVFGTGSAGTDISKLLNKNVNLNGKEQTVQTVITTVGK